MKTTSKRTTAKTATDIEGQVIRLLKTKLTSHKGHNSLSYAEVRRAMSARDSVVYVRTCDAGFMPRHFEKLEEDKRMWIRLSPKANKAFSQGPVFRIGCHFFTLKMFNRILRAAGVRTTKATTVKKFAARA